MRPTLGWSPGARATISATRSRDRGGRFLVPLVVVMGLISIYPTAFSFVMSFFDWNWGARLNPVGLTNYIGTLTSGPFQTALANTFVFTVFAVGIEFLAGFGLALAVNRLRRGAQLLRTLLLVPLMVSGIIVAIIWKVLLDPTLGIVNVGLHALGIGPLGFFGDPAMAMASVILVDVWWGTAFVFIVLLAGLQSLPQEPIEAAKVDGANAPQGLWYVVVPLLRPVILVVLLFRTIDCLKVFAIIYGTTGGGPLQVTESIQTLAYRTALKQLNMSESMTIMVLFAIVVAAVVLVYQRLGAAQETLR